MQFEIPLIRKFVAPALKLALGTTLLCLATGEARAQ